VCSICDLWQGGSVCERAAGSNAVFGSLCACSDSNLAIETCEVAGVKEKAWSHIQILLILAAWASGTSGPSLSAAM
jgi:hypothetical protein